MVEIDSPSDIGFSEYSLKSVKIPTFIISALVFITVVSWTNAIQAWVREVFAKKKTPNQVSEVPESSIMLWFSVLMTGITVIFVAAFSSDYFKGLIPNPNW